LCRTRETEEELAMLSSHESKNPLMLPIIDTLERVEWNDISQVERAVIPVLRELVSDRNRLVAAMELVFEDADMFQRCESTEFFDRVILYESPTNRFSIRLLSMRPLDRDIPHNHRASFATFVLAGGYQHTIYNSPSGLVDAQLISDEQLLAGLEKVYERWEQPGSLYALHPAAIHSTRPIDGHLSLNIRGPSVLGRRLVLDPAKISPVWVDGGSDQRGPRMADHKMAADVMKSLIDMARYSNARHVNTVRVLLDERNPDS
jgi:hypothetical protein